VLFDKTVKEKIPEVGRRKINAHALLAVILEVVDGEFFRFGTKAVTTLSQLFTRNRFTLCEEIFLGLVIIPETDRYSASGFSVLFNWWTRVNEM